MNEIQQKYLEHMNAVMDALCDLFPGSGVALLVFEFGDAKRINYISNAEREDMLIAMKEFVARNEGRVMKTPDTVQ
jgi:hypothetical protein